MLPREEEATTHSAEAVMHLRDAADTDSHSVEAMLPKDVVVTDNHNAEVMHHREEAVTDSHSVRADSANSALPDMIRMQSTA